MCIEWIFTELSVDGKDEGDDKSYIIYLYFLLSPYSYAYIQPHHTYDFFSHFEEPSLGHSSPGENNIPLEVHRKKAHLHFVGSPPKIAILEMGWTLCH